MTILNDVLNKLPENNGKKKICILSGGLDSTILLYLLNRKYQNNVVAFTVDYSQKHNIEMEMAKQSTRMLNIPHQIIPMAFYGDIISSVSALSNSEKVEMPTIDDILGDPQPVSYVPFRNMLFSTIAFSFAEAISADKIFIGLQAHDLYSYWDTSPEFIDRLNHIAELNRQNQIEIIAPFVDMSKKDEIIIGKQLNVPLQLTWTCYNGPDQEGRACGKCPSCSERIKNFIDAGLKDPLPYTIDVKWIPETTIIEE